MFVRVWMGLANQWIKRGRGIYVSLMATRRSKKRSDIAFKIPSFNRILLRKPKILLTLTHTTQQCYIFYGQRQFFPAPS